MTVREVYIWREVEANTNIMQQFRFSLIVETRCILYYLQRIQEYAARFIPGMPNIIYFIVKFHLFLSPHEQSMFLCQNQILSLYLRDILSLCKLRDRSLSPHPLSLLSWPRNLEQTLSTFRHLSCVMAVNFWLKESSG